MNEIIMKKAKKLSLNPERLNDIIEQCPIEWLYKDQTISGYDSNLNMLKGNILCMNQAHSNYLNMKDEDKEKAIELIEHADIVDMVLVTIFQWFGTNVGKSEIGVLMDEIKELEHSEPEKHLKTCDICGQSFTGTDFEDTCWKCGWKPMHPDKESSDEFTYG